VPRRQAGARYPHATTDAKPHNHRFCPVVAKIIDRVTEGGEPWGTRHEMPAVISEDEARKARTGFYAARYCRQLRNALGEPASIQSNYEPRGDAWIVWVRVWPRSVAKQEIARRVASGEPLAYNIVSKRSA